MPSLLLGIFILRRKQMTNVVVGQPMLQDGFNPDTIRLGRDGDLISSKLHGDYFEQTRRGNVYMYNSGGAGITVLKYDNVNPVFVLWNKSTAYYLELIEVVISLTNATEVVGGLHWGLIPNAGIALGTPITAFTELATIYNLKTLSVASPPNGKCATTSTIVALAATALIPIGISFPAVTGASPVLGVRQYPGNFLVPPGVALVLTGNVAQTQAVGFTLTWIDNVPF
jgi:hypothetical protein